MKNYDLYEGDGEMIGEAERPEKGPALPGRKPLGRDAELRRRDEYARKAERAVLDRRQFQAMLLQDLLCLPDLLQCVI